MRNALAARTTWDWMFRKFVFYYYPLHKQIYMWQVSLLWKAKCQLFSNYICYMKFGQFWWNLILQNALFISSWLHISLVALTDGSLLASHTLPCQPVSPVVQGDFTNDGLTDFVVHCSDRYNGVPFYLLLFYQQWHSSMTILRQMI